MGSAVYTVGFLAAWVVFFFGVRAYWRTTGPEWDASDDVLSALLSFLAAILWPFVVAAAIIAAAFFFVLRLLRPLVDAGDRVADGIVNKSDLGRARRPR